MKLSIFITSLLPLLGAAASSGIALPELNDVAIASGRFEKVDDLTKTNDTKIESWEIMM